MIFKILLFRSVQAPNIDKNWQTSCPLQTFVCNISRHLEFIRANRTGSPGQMGLQVAGFSGHWVAGSQNVTQFHVCCIDVKFIRSSACTLWSDRKNFLLISKYVSCIGVAIRVADYPTMRLLYAVSFRKLNIFMNSLFAS